LERVGATGGPCSPFEFRGTSSRTLGRDQHEHIKRTQHERDAGWRTEEEEEKKKSFEMQFHLKFLSQSALIATWKNGKMGFKENIKDRKVSSKAIADSATVKFSSLRKC
jgi:hypothetical protein